MAKCNSKESSNTAQNTIYYGMVETEMGWVGVAGNNEGLLRLILPEKSPENILAELDFYFRSGERLVRKEELFSALAEKIKNYFAGKPTEFNQEKLNLTGYTPFQKKVLLITRDIPYGVTETYRWLAEQAGFPMAYRAAGGVMRINPLPLVIPCHRVIGSNGQLTGFSSRGGLDLKRRMLALEGVLIT